MCVIVDANMAGRFFGVPPDRDLFPLWKWIHEGKGVLVYGGLLTDELFRVRNAADTIQEWERTGRAARVRRAEVESETAEIGRTGRCVSDDQHVIALARVSGTRLLCSGDRALHEDFRNRALIDNPRGAIYQNAGHTRLLRCRPGCRFKAPAADR